MNVYVVSVTNTRNKSSYVKQIFDENSEEAAYEEQEILQHELGEDFYVDVEEMEVRKGDEGFNA